MLRLSAANCHFFQISALQELAQLYKQVLNLRSHDDP
jgi:hypothetical protein